MNWKRIIGWTAGIILGLALFIFVGGFFLLDCETREQALSHAAECPAAEWATIEVREVGPCYE